MIPDRQTETKLAKLYYDLAVERKRLVAKHAKIVTEENRILTERALYEFLEVDYIEG